MSPQANHPKRTEMQPRVRRAFMEELFPGPRNVRFHGNVGRRVSPPPSGGIPNSPGALRNPFLKLSLTHVVLSPPKKHLSGASPVFFCLDLIRTLQVELGKSLEATQVAARPENPCTGIFSEPVVGVGGGGASGMCQVTLNWCFGLEVSGFGHKNQGNHSLTTKPRMQTTIRGIR